MAEQTHHSDLSVTQIPHIEAVTADAIKPDSNLRKSLTLKLLLLTL